MTHETYKRGARRFGGKKRARFVRLLGNMTFPDGVILAFNKISFHSWTIGLLLRRFAVESFGGNYLCSSLKLDLEAKVTSGLGGNCCFMLADKKEVPNCVFQIL